MKDSYMYSVLGMKIWIDWSKANSWIYFYLILNKNCKILLILGLRTGALVLGPRTSAHREKRSVQSMFMLPILVTSLSLIQYYMWPHVHSVLFLHHPLSLSPHCKSLISYNVRLMVKKNVPFKLWCYMPWYILLLCICVD
jgi:hypothetical protein